MSFDDAAQHSMVTNPCPYCNHGRASANAPCDNCGWEPDAKTLGGGDTRSDQYVALGVGALLATALVIKLLRERK